MRSLLRRAGRSTWLGAFLLLLGAAVLVPRAQAAEGVPAAPVAIDVWLLTIEPGALYWERFGHNAILLRDAASGTGTSYNFGYFDFDQSGFMLRFLQGRMLYMAVALDGHADLQSYLSEGRRVWLQRLDLDPAATARLQEHLQRQVSPEQRNYRYDYYQINCSTKVRDAIDLALDGALRTATAHRSHGWTWRRFTRAYAQDVPWMYLGTDLLLGQPVDRPISIWEEGFIPGELKRQLRDFRHPDGRPLVLEERLLPTGAESAEVWPLAPDWRVGYLAAGLFSAGILGLLTALAPRRRAARVALGGLGIVLVVIIALAGSLIAALWFATDHDAAARNENLFLLLPLWLLTLPAWWGLARGRIANPAWVQRAQLIAWLAVLCAGLGLFAKVLRSFDQGNIEWHLLLLPILLTLHRALQALPALLPRR